MNFWKSLEIILYRVGNAVRAKDTETGWFFSQTNHFIAVFVVFFIRTEEYNIYRKNKSHSGNCKKEVGSAYHQLLKPRNSGFFYNF